MKGQYCHCGYGCFVRCYSVHSSSNQLIVWQPWTHCTGISRNGKCVPQLMEGNTCHGFKIFFGPVPILLFSSQKNQKWTAESLCWSWSWRCVRDDKEHKGQVQCQGVLSPPPPSLLSSSQGSTPLCPIILCFTNKCS